jgi:uncharacterized protein YlxP (DUF503 family)
MIIGILNLEIEIPSAMSLKDKRAILNSIQTRTRQKFNVAIAETDDQDIWNAATISIVTVSNEQQHANSILTNVLAHIETYRSCFITDTTVEFI